MPGTRPTLPVHRYRLRPDCTVRLDLPDDLTRREAKRLALFVKSLVRQADWPYPVAGDAIDDDFSSLDETDDDFPEDEDNDLDDKEIAAFFDQCERDEKRGPEKIDTPDAATQDEEAAARATSDADFPNL